MRSPSCNNSVYSRRRVDDAELLALDFKPNNHRTTIFRAWTWKQGCRSYKHEMMCSDPGLKVNGRLVVRGDLFSCRATMYLEMVVLCTTKNIRFRITWLRGLLLPYMNTELRSNCTSIQSRFFKFHFRCSISHRRMTQYWILPVSVSPCLMNEPMTKIVFFLLRCFTISDKVSPVVSG